MAKRASAAAVLVGLCLCVPIEAHAIDLCSGSHRVTCIVDGDTLWWEGEKIRIEDIDAPEVHAPCTAERDLARAATLRLQALIADSEPEIERTGVDRFGRTLADVSIAGRDLGHVMVAEGLARPWLGHKEHWCD
jgi:endonuclease YncB( thermonuclease family)